MTDRPVLDEIEVTEEMIEAGVDALNGHYLDLISPHHGDLPATVVCDVFRAMMTQAQLESHPAEQQIA
jgi:hypothetical protein